MWIDRGIYRQTDRYKDTKIDRYIVIYINKQIDTNIYMAGYKDRKIERCKRRKGGHKPKMLFFYGTFSFSQYSKRT